MAEYALETGDPETRWRGSSNGRPSDDGRYAAARRGLLLLTAHRARGLEFEHVVVLDGDWARLGRGEDADAPRRLYYVAMTRAMQTLTLMRLLGPNPLQDALSAVPATLFRDVPAAHPAPAPELARSYRRFGLGDVFISFAGYRQPGHPVQGAIAALSPGDLLEVRAGPERWELLDWNGTVVGQLARTFKPPRGMRCEYATVMAIVMWDRECSEAQFQANLRSDSWEVMMPEG